MRDGVWLGGLDFYGRIEMGEVKNVSISLQPWLLWSGEGRGGADLKLVQVVGAVRGGGG